MQLTLALIVAVLAAETAEDLTCLNPAAGEPAALQRSSIGVWVVLFLALLTFLSWLVKHEYWKDVE